MIFDIFYVYCDRRYMMSTFKIGNKYDSYGSYNNFIIQNVNVI